MCVYGLHCCCLCIALTSVDKGSFLEMLTNKTANEKSTKKEVKVNHFVLLYSTLEYLHVVT